MSRDREKRIVLPATLEGASGPIPRRTVLAYTGAAFATTLLPHGPIGCGDKMDAESIRQAMEAMIVLSNATMTPKLLGPQPWAVILCHTSDIAVPTWPSVSYFQELISAGKGGLRDYWDSVSRGSISLEGSAVFGWYQFAESQATIAGWTRIKLFANARAAASAAGQNLSAFAHALVVATGYPDGGGDSGSVAYNVFGSTGQPFWRHCSKCQMLAFWDGTQLPGACAGNDGPHDHNGSAIYAPLDANSTFSGLQTGWSRCRQCQAMIYSLNALSDCPAGGKHNLFGSAAFALRLGGSTVDLEQDGWRRCRKCNGFAYSLDSTPGACPAQGLHDFSQSGSYSVPYAWSADLGFLAHETGHGFGLDHSFGEGRSGAFGNDNRPGAYGDGTDPMGSPARSTVAHFTVGVGLHAPNLRKLGWIPASSVLRFASGLGTQSVTIAPLYGGTFGTPPASVVMAQIDRPDEGAVYTVEYRVPKQTNGVNWDAGLDHARVVVHRMQSMYMAGQNSWRHCSSCAGMVYAGETACPAGGVHDGSTSSDYGLLQVGSGSGQANWRFCRKCSGLAFAGNSTSGVCCTGGAHDFSGSGNYVLASSGIGQSGWRWCKKCQGLGFSGGAVPGPCPAKGMHDYSASGNYVIGRGTDAAVQNKWRYCNKCQGMYFAGATACKGGAVHTLGDQTDYSITNGYSDRDGQSGWRHCAKCAGLAFGSSPQGACAGGETHDLSSSLSYTVRIDAELTRGQMGWFWCKKCGCLNHDGTAGPGVCKGGGNHERADHATELLVPHDTSDVPGQSDFRWCDRCCSLVKGANPPGCAAGGNHRTGTSFNYVVRNNPGTRVHEQSFWSLCTKCNVLMAVDSPAGSSAKPCGGGDNHSPQGEFFLTIAWMDPRWQWCRNCQLLATWDGSNATGPCPAGGTHDHSQSSFYTPPYFSGEVTVVVAADLQPGQTYTNPNGGVVVNVVSFGNDVAIFNLTSS